MNTFWEKTIPPDLDALTQCMEECSEFLATDGVPGEALFAIQLAIEEMATNTFKYGSGGGEPRPITIRAERGVNQVELIISDDALPFDPFSVAEPDLSLPAEERQVGGLGIHLVRKLMTGCAYAREGKLNVVRLVKKWEPAVESH